MESFEDRFEKIEHYENEKDKLLKELMVENKGLREVRHQIQKELDVSRYTCEKMSEDLMKRREETSGLQKTMSCDPFVLVLIDGDITKFSDEYITRGAPGGHDAARDLRNAVYEYFKPKPDFLLDTKIVIHIFANIAGMGKTYLESKSLADPVVLRLFLQGFNREHALSHFIDAGDDKEAADSKVKAETALFYSNSHCKHIMFAGSGDNSYAGFLRQYSLTSQICSRIVLVESIPFPSTLGELADKFEKTKFEGLFRDTKIETRRSSLRDDTSNRPQRSPPTSYASTVKQIMQGPTELSGGGLKDLVGPSNSERIERRKILQNKQGQRVDQIVKADKGLVTSLKPRKLCNRHFLTRCNYMSCMHSHEGTLTPAQTEALRYIARLSPCQSLYCDDADCVAGHRCMAGAKCDRRGSNCWFSEEMHNVDTNIVTSI